MDPLRPDLDLSIDFETRSEAELKSRTSFAYAQHPSTLVLVQSWAYPGQEPQYVTLEDVGPNTIAPFIKAHLDAGGRLRAFNASFEYAILKYTLGVAIEPHQIICTQQQCLGSGLPATLEMAATALDLDEQKGDSKLMLQMCKPLPDKDAARRMGDDYDPERKYFLHELEPELLEPLAAYCVQDVRTEQAIAAVVPPLSPFELSVTIADRAINDMGFLIDRAFAARLQAIADAEIPKFNARAAELSAGVDNPKKNQVTSVGTQRDRVKAFLNDAFAGVLTVPNLKGDTIEELLVDAAPYKETHAAGYEMLQLRSLAAKAALAKLKAAKINSERDGVLRGGLRYAGAGRSSRWSGMKFQPQNLPRPTIKSTAYASTSISMGLSGADLELLYEAPALDIVSSCIRGVVVPRPGMVFVGSDLSQIEARTLPWLAGNSKVVGWYREGRDVYTETAIAIGQGPEQRQLGKTLVLAAGYGMGGAKFQNTCRKAKLVFTEEEATDFIKAFREANAETVAFWHALDEAARECVEAGPGHVARVGEFIQLTMGTRKLKGCLLMRLPSGRSIVYRKARLEDAPTTDADFFFARRQRQDVVFEGTKKAASSADNDNDDDDEGVEGPLRQIRGYPGMWANHATQSAARDVMATMLMQIYERRAELGDVVLHVHDEIVVECPAERAEYVKAEIGKIMSTPPSWAPGLPIACETKIMQRYGK